MPRVTAPLARPYLRNLGLDSLNVLALEIVDLV